MIGNYRLLRLLDEYVGCARYLAEDVSTHTLVQISLLAPPGRGRLNGALHLLNWLAGIEHPQIQGLFDIGEVSGCLYYTSEYLPAGSLRERHHPGAILPLELVRHYVQQIAQPLHYLHSLGAVYASLRPENILVHAGNDLILSDFGLREYLFRLHFGDVIHPLFLRYTAPELLRGWRLPASDQYMLALLLYEWLSGAHPFDDTLQALSEAHLKKQPPSLLEHMPLLPEAVDEVLQIALAKDPMRRFASIRAFATAFEQACKA